ncbi:oxidoreductase [Shouchella clausii]|uniref:phosphogluconate dehydrogenase C-terminal domain-containing protein n=1 Tax=Shouchella tritolerans TaxID=2979466 RepID=UPI001B02D7BB|nr:phosphogluconate dehydrogenase C-terminal domain-containing protein [Shouchella tritolerans]GIN11624.1 oxidoreductase [Shouchella clausii]
MSDKNAIVAVIGAGGKMGTRITNNLVKCNEYELKLCETSPRKIEEIEAKGLQISEMNETVKSSDVVILAVPDTAIGNVSKQIVPNMKAGAVLLTLDPAAAYAGLLHTREDITSIVAHPCHPSVFGKYLTEEEHADFFGGIAAEQDVVIAKYSGDEDKFNVGQEVVRNMYAPVGEIHRITVKDMAILEPTLAEVITCMIGTVFKESLEETVKKGVPEKAAKAMLYGHIQIALSVALKGTNPFSDAAMIAIDYGKEAIIKSDWKRVFNDEELDKVVGKMLKLEQPVNR